MKWRVLVLISLLGITLLSGLATAFPAKPGTRCPLVLNNYPITTDTLILPDWKPSRIRWNLINPHGQIVSFVDANINQIGQGGGWSPGTTTWLVTTNSGFMEIPAFAEQGEYRMNAMFYDKFFIFMSQTGADIYSINVGEGSVVESLNAPVSYILGVPILGDFCITVEVVYLIAFVVLIPLLLLIVITLKKKGRR
jgi:hypothetical protein